MSWLFGPSDSEKQRRAQGMQRERLELLREFKTSIQATFEFVSVGSKETGQTGARVGDYELSEKNDRVVEDLLMWLERCMWHGLRTEAKVRKRNAYGKYEFSKVSDISIWNYIQFFATIGTKQETQAVDALHNINSRFAASVMDVRDLLFVRSNTGKGRAWLRLALTEKILDAAVGKICSEPGILNTYYNSFALLRDEEASNIFVSLLSGLNGLQFKLHTDLEWFDKRDPPLRRPVMLIPAGSPVTPPRSPTNVGRVLHPFIGGKTEGAEMSAGRKSPEKLELDILRKKLDNVSKKQAASEQNSNPKPAPSGWKGMLAGAVDYATQAVSIHTTNQKGGTMDKGLLRNFEAKNKAALALHKRALEKIHAKLKARRELKLKTEPVIGVSLDLLVQSITTSALAYQEPRIAVPDILLRCVALVWSTVTEYEAQGKLIQNLAVRAEHQHEHYGEVLKLKHYLLQLGGDGLTIYSRVGVDTDLDTAFECICTRTRAGIANSEKMCDPTLVVGLIKLFLRQLPEPLMPFEVHEPMLLCMGIEEEDARIRNLECLVDTIPTSHKASLEIVLLLLNKLSTIDASHVTADELAASIFRPGVVGEERDTHHHAATEQEVGKFKTTCRLLLEMEQHHEKVLANVQADILSLRKLLAEKHNRIRKARDGLSRALGNSSMEDIQPCLDTLWNVLGDNQDNSKVLLVSDGWKERGSMNCDLSSEFRGGGETALYDLTYFVKRHSKKAVQILKAGRYPFIQSACQVSRMTANILDITMQDFDASSKSLSHNVASKPWWGMLNDPESIHRVFCMALLLLDMNFIESNATTMDFNKVIQETKFQMLDLLSLEPRSVNQLWHQWIQQRAERMILKAEVEEKEKAQLEKAKARESTTKPNPPQAANDVESSPKATTDMAITSPALSSTDHKANSSTDVSPPTTVAEMQSTLQKRGSSYMDELLPQLLDSTETLTKTHVSKLETSLPTSYHGYDWALAFSTSKHGADINDFYRLASKHDASLLIIKDTDGGIFGGFCATPWKKSTGGYVGSGECFVFTLEPEFNAYRWSQSNSYFMLPNEDSLSMGGGGGVFGIFIDEDLQTGQSESCETFNNPVLSSTTDFEIQSMELWVFKVRNRS